MFGIPESLQTLVAESLAAPACGLHDSTSAEAIAFLHREEVAAFFARHPLASVEEASAALVLPEWNVEKALALNRGEPIPYRKWKPPPKENDRKEKMSWTDHLGWPVKQKKLEPKPKQRKAVATCHS